MTKVEWAQRQWQVHVEVKNLTGGPASPGLWGFDDVRLVSSGGDAFPRLGFHRLHIEKLIGPDVAPDSVAKSEIAVARHASGDPAYVEVVVLKPDAYRTYLGVKYEVPSPSFRFAMHPPPRQSACAPMVTQATKTL